DVVALFHPADGCAHVHDLVGCAVAVGEGEASRPALSFGCHIQDTPPAATGLLLVPVIGTALHAHNLRSLLLGIADSAARCRRVDVLLRTVIDVWYLPYEVVGGACLAVRGGEDDAGLSGAPRGRVVRVEPAEVS